jgi:hypothetical protein
MMKSQAVFLAAMGILLLAGAESSFAKEAVPAQLQPPGGEKALFEAHAEGMQIYVSTQQAGEALKWVLEAPLADLTAQQDKFVIHHYVGPSWEANDGSKIWLAEHEKPVAVAAPNPNSDIPWLLLKVTHDPDPAAGVLGKVDYVQRISTKGGIMPSKPPLRPNTKVGVPYTATYVFYGKAD